MSVRFLSDEDFDNDILRGVLHRNAEVDLVRVQDVGLSGADDQDILEWAAEHGCVLLTHDVSTMKTHALVRIQSALAIGNGMVTATLVGGALPMLEHIFRITTDISWLEASDPRWSRRAD